MKKFKLPIKWAVKRNLDNSAILNEWNNNHPLFREQNRIEAISICDMDYFYDDQQHSNCLLDKYTEITFEQFKQYVLNKKPEPNNHIKLISMLKYINERNRTFT